MQVKTDNKNSDGLEIVELDDILQEFKLSDKYHLVFIFFFGLAALSNTLYSKNYVYAVRAVNYRCEYKGCNDISINSLFPGSDECRRHLPKKENALCNLEDYYQNVTVPCEKWIYEDPTSFVAEFGLGCQDWKTTLVGSLHSFGHMIGLLITGPLSDRFGRKICIIVFGVLGSIFGVARGFVTSYWVYVIFEILEAIFGDPSSPLFTLTVELAPQKKRIWLTTVIGIADALAYAVAGGLMWVLPYWRHFLFAIYTPAILFTLFIFVTDESPRWLLIKGRKQEAINILKKIAKTNNITIDNRKLENLRIKEESKFLSLTQILKITFSSRILLVRFGACIVWWTSTLFICYGSTVNLALIKGNIYMNFGLQSISDICAHLLAAFVQKYLKRKKPVFCLFLLAGMFFISQAFLQTSSYSWLPLVLYLGGRLMTMTLFYIVYLYTSELFPTYSRNTMHAVCSGIGRIGAILAPQTPLLMKYWSGLPFVLFGSVALSASFVTFLVPDAGEEVLPDNVKEAEEFGNSKPIKLPVILKTRY